MTFKLNSALYKKNKKSSQNNRQTAFQNTKKVSNKYQLGSQLGGVVSMTKTSVFPQTPAVQFSTGCDGSAVRAAAGDISNAFSLQCFNQPWLIAVPGTKKHHLSHQSFNCVLHVWDSGKNNLHPAKVSKLSVVSFTPRKHFPIYSQSHRMPSTCRRANRVKQQVLTVLVMFILKWRAEGSDRSVRQLFSPHSC